MRKNSWHWQQAIPSFTAVSCRSAFILLTFLPSLKVFRNKWSSISNPCVLSTWIQVDVCSCEKSSSCAVASCPAAFRSFNTLPGLGWWGSCLKCTLGAQAPPQGLTASRLGHSQPEFSLLKSPGKGSDNFLSHRDEWGQYVSLALLWV